MSSLRESINQPLKEKKDNILVTYESYFDEQEDAAYFEARSSFDSDSKENFLSPAGSTLSLQPLSSGSSTSRGFARGSTTPLPTIIAEELDALADAAERRGHTCNHLTEGESGPGAKAFSRCLTYKTRYNHHPDYLWRLARAAYLVAIERQKEQAEEHNLNPGQLQTFLELTEYGLYVARRAVHLSKESLKRGTISPSDASQSFKWLAIFVGLIAQRGGIKQRIEAGFEFKELVDTALEMDPSDAYLHFLKGRWCFEVYNLSWVERQIASRLFLEPPTATIKEAFDEFCEVERLKPALWATNAVYLAKCEYSRGNYSSATDWLAKAVAVLQSPDGIIGDQVDKNTLLSEISQLNASWSSWSGK